MTADEPVAGVPRLCARRAGCTRPRGHDGFCGPDRDQASLLRPPADLESPDVVGPMVRTVDAQVAARTAELRAEVETLQMVAEMLRMACDMWREIARHHQNKRDALQRQVDAVRALTMNADQPGRWVLPDDEDAPAVWVYDIDAALDAVEPADQPHPTPEAPSGRVVNGFQVCSAHDLAECPFCESDQR